MTVPSFHAAMTIEELLDGEARHRDIEQSRKLAMAAGLTKSSRQLRDTWEKNPEAYTTLLKGAVAAYEQNELVEELLRGAMARLASIVTDSDPELLKVVMSIIGSGGKEGDLYNFP
ncbi:MAG: hypothetical protein R3F50_17055 [Gammaproteobacteria bacterium]